MSGTSVDGVDFSLVETNGTDYVKIITGKSYEYNKNYKLKVKEFIKQIQNNFPNKEIKFVELITSINTILLV